MSCNPSSVREVETFHGLVPGVTNTVRLGYSQRKKGLPPWLFTVEKMTKNEQTSYIFAKCKGERAHTITQIEHIPNFAEAHVIPGAFDILAAFRADSSEELLKGSVEKIGSINGITASETLISYSLPGRTERF